LQYLYVNQSYNAQNIRSTTQTKGITFWNKIYCMYYNTTPIKWWRKENLWKVYYGKIDMHIRFDIRSHFFNKTLMWWTISHITLVLITLLPIFGAFMIFKKKNLFALQTPCTMTLKECLWLWESPRVIGILLDGPKEKNTYTINEACNWQGVNQISKSSNNKFQTLSSMWAKIKSYKAYYLYERMSYAKSLCFPKKHQVPTLCRLTNNSVLFHGSQHCA